MELAGVQRRILRYVESRLRELSCLVVSDYAKGVVSATLTDLTRLAHFMEYLVVVRKSNTSATTRGDGHHAEPS